MDASIKSMNGFSFGILSAMIVTASLFVTLPLLTQHQKPPHIPIKAEPVFLDMQRPLPPPSEKPEDPKKQTLAEKKIIEMKDPSRQPKPKFDIPRADSISAINGAIEIRINTTIEDVVAISGRTYNPEDVDQAPRLLRSFPLRYPYLAQRDNLEGWVMLRFVVDSEGGVGKVEVVAAEPEGVFEEAALKAVAHYKFKPAMKSGRAVNCIMKHQVNFEIK